jgi:hypothetical protein
MLCEELLREQATKLLTLADKVEQLRITPGETAWELFGIVEQLIHEANMRKD